MKNEELFAGSKKMEAEPSFIEQAEEQLVRCWPTPPPPKNRSRRTGESASWQADIASTRRRAWKRRLRKLPSSPAELAIVARENCHRRLRRLPSSHATFCRSGAPPSNARQCFFMFPTNNSSFFFFNSYFFCIFAPAIRQVWL